MHERGFQLLKFTLFHLFILMHDTCIHPPTNVDIFSVLKKHFLGAFLPTLRLWIRPVGVLKELLEWSAVCQKKVSLLNLYTLCKPGSYFTSAPPAYEGIFLCCVI